LLGDRESHISDIHFHGESKLRALVQFENARKTRKTPVATNGGDEGTLISGALKSYETPFSQGHFTALAGPGHRAPPPRV
jgi:hypothetical protein